MNNRERPRCSMAITFGETLTTRCQRVQGHEGQHEGNGRPSFPYERVSWLPGDQREFVTDRLDRHAWEIEP